MSHQRAHPHRSPLPRGTRGALKLLDLGRSGRLLQIGQESGVGRLARIGCSRKAALLNPIPFFASKSFLMSGRATSKMEWLGIFRNVRASKHPAAVLRLLGNLQPGFFRRGHPKHPQPDGLGFVSRLQMEDFHKKQPQKQGRPYQAQRQKTTQAASLVPDIRFWKAHLTATIYSGE